MADSPVQKTFRLINQARVTLGHPSLQGLRHGGVRGPICPLQQSLADIYPHLRVFQFWMVLPAEQAQELAMALGVKSQRLLDGYGRIYFWGKLFCFCRTVRKIDWGGLPELTTPQSKPAAEDAAVEASYYELFRADPVVLAPKPSSVAVGSTSDVELVGRPGHLLRV